MTEHIIFIFCTFYLITKIIFSWYRVNFAVPGRSERHEKFRKIVACFVGEIRPKINCIRIVTVPELVTARPDLLSAKSAGHAACNIGSDKRNTESYCNMIW